MIMTITERSSLRRLFSRFFLIGTTLAGAAAIPQATRGSMIVIDDFTTTQSAVATASSPIASSSTMAPEAIGGERDMLVNLTGGFTSLSLNSNPFGGELLIHDSGATVTGYSLTVWDGIDMNAGTIDYDGLGGVDLTMGGMLNRFALSFLSADLAGSINLTVYDASDMTGNTWSSAEFLLPGSIFSPTDVDVMFSSFTDIGPNGAADFTNVGAISMMIQNESSGSLDVLLSSVSVVPEPTGIVTLLMGGLLTLGRLRRSRRTIG